MLKFRENEKLAKCRNFITVQDKETKLLIRVEMVTENMQIN